MRQTCPVGVGIVEALHLRRDYLGVLEALLLLLNQRRAVKVDHSKDIGERPLPQKTLPLLASS